MEVGNPEIAQPSIAMYGMATVSLPIYAGSKIKYGIQAAHFLEEAVKLDAENDREKIILNTINAYANLYKSIAAVRLVKENLNQSQQKIKTFPILKKTACLQGTIF